MKRLTELMITRGALCLICLSAIASSAVSRPPECPENFCFFVQDLSKNGEELIGDFEFWNLTFDPVRLPPDEIIRGVQRADGNFYPLCDASGVAKSRRSLEHCSLGHASRQTSESDRASDD